MTKLEFESVKSQSLNVKDLSNDALISNMDYLSSEFETTKNMLIELTHYFDVLEELYNINLKEYQSRGNE